MKDVHLVSEAVVVLLLRPQALPVRQFHGQFLINLKPISNQRLNTFILQHLILLRNKKIEDFGDSRYDDQILAITAAITSLWCDTNDSKKIKKQTKLSIKMRIRLMMAAEMETTRVALLYRMGSSSMYKTARSEIL